MNEHPYWAYAAVPGTINGDREEEVLAEGRRERALELAISSTSIDGSVSVILAVARKFEEYLKGDTDSDQ